VVAGPDCPGPRPGECIEGPALETLEVVAILPEQRLERPGGDLREVGPEHLDATLALSLLMRRRILTRNRLSGQSTGRPQADAWNSPSCRAASLRASVRGERPT